MLMLAAAGLLAAAGPTPDAALGMWKTPTRNGVIEIQRCGASVCGHLVSSDGLKANPALADTKNADPKLRTRPLHGLPMLTGFTRDGDGWSGGSIYNPDDGKTYGAKLTPDGTDRLKVRGCIFVPFCKTQTWTRLR